MDSENQEKTEKSLFRTQKAPCRNGQRAQKSPEPSGTGLGNSKEIKEVYYCFNLTIFDGFFVMMALLCMFSPLLS